MRRTAAEDKQVVRSRYLESVDYTYCWFSRVYFLCSETFVIEDVTTCHSKIT